MGSATEEPLCLAQWPCVSSQHVHAHALTCALPPHHLRHGIPRSKGDGDYEICDDFIVDEWLRNKIRSSEDELQKEKECVSHLIGMMGGACSLRGVEDTTVPGEN